MTPLLQRFHDRGTIDAPRPLPIRPGTRADYLALKQHHYRPGHPMTMMRIFVIHDDHPSATDRYLQRGPEPRPVAVLVETLPGLSCRLRDEALSGRYQHLRPRQRSALLNQELRCISRVIVDPRWRGLGLAVRLVRHALETATTRYTEALAVMGRVSPFFERAGMTGYQRPPLPADERALAALRYAGIAPEQLATPETLGRRIDTLPAQPRALVERELRRWHRTAGGRAATSSATIGDVLRAAQQRLLARPIYYLHENTHVRLPHGGPA